MNRFHARRAAPLRLLLFVALCLGLWTQPAASQTASVTDDLMALDLTPRERSDLLARLSDEQVRELLIRYLDQTTSSAAGADGYAGIMGVLSHEAHNIRDNLRATLAEARNLPDVLPFAYEKLTEGRSAFHPLIVLLGLIAIFAVGAAAEWGFRRLSLQFQRRVEQTRPTSGGAKFGRLSLRALLDLLAVAIFGLAVVGAFFVLYQGHEPTRLMVMTYVGAVMIVRIAWVGSRFLLAPNLPELRLVRLDDETARILHTRVLWITGVAAFGFLTCGLMQLLGLEPRLHQLLLMIVGIVFVLMIALTVWRIRTAISVLISGRNDDGTEPGMIRRALAETWHILAILYLAGVYVFAIINGLLGRAVGVGGAIGSILVVVALPLASAALDHLVEGLFAGRKGAGAGLRPSGYQLVVLRALRILLVLIAVVIMARLWGIDLFSLAERGLGGAVARTILDIGFTVLLAYVGWEMVMTAIDRYLDSGQDSAAVERGAEGGGQGASRLKTLLPLFRRFLQITIVVMVAMIVLSSLGVDIGPLIAGAGVLGLAIGFGAQALVRDIVSGVFFLVYDAFRLGEYVDIGSVKGTVEGISVRSLVLRHHRGPLHTVPFGEIQYLTNYSRDWVIMKLPFRLTYDTDVNKVKKILKQIGADLMADELLGEYFLEPLKSQGVQAMEDSAMIVRAKFMAKPGFQFQIRKEVYSRVQKAFQEQGIEFAHRRVTVDLPPGVDKDSPHGRAMADAAAAAEITKDQDVQAPA